MRWVLALLNGNANFTGTVTAGSFTGNGAGLTNLSVAGGTPASATNQTHKARRRI